MVEAAIRAGAKSKEPHCPDPLEPLVHRGGRIHRYLRAHPPRRVPARLRYRHVAHLPEGAIPERPARCREDDPGDVLLPVTLDRLEDRGVLAVDGEDSAAAAPCALHEELPRHHEQFLVREGDPLPLTGGLDDGADGHHPRRGGHEHVPPPGRRGRPRPSPASGWTPGRLSLWPASSPPPRKRCEQREQIQHRPCGDDGVRPVEYPPVTRQKRPAVFHPRGSLEEGFEEIPRLPRYPYGRGGKGDEPGGHPGQEQNTVPGPQNDARREPPEGALDRLVRGDIRGEAPFPERPADEIGEDVPREDRYQAQEDPVLSGGKLDGAGVRGEEPADGDGTERRKRRTPRLLRGGVPAPQEVERQQRDAVQHGRTVRPEREGQ